VATATAVSHLPETGFGAELAQLEGAVTLSNLSRGTQLYAYGDPADRVFAVKSGRVKTFVQGPGGKDCLFHIVEPGEIFGENALMGDRVRQSDAEVLERASISMIPTRSVMRYVERRPEFWLSLAPLLRRRMRDLEQQVQWVSFLEVEQRIARLVLRWAHSAGPHGGSLRFEISQRDLAAMVGATRETASSALNRLQREGCIEIRRRQVILLSIDKLTRRAGTFAVHPPAGDVDAPELVQATGA